MTYNTEITNLLKKKNIKETAIRILVLQFFLKSKGAISLPYLERTFYFSDRSSLFRTLKTFEKKGLIHEINDGNQRVNYALCIDDCQNGTHIDEHPHFYCEECLITTCLNSVPIPNFLYGNSIIHSTEVILKGICVECNNVA